jgi:hypothetical protein
VKALGVNDDYRRALTEQIIRDEQTIAGDTAYHHPSLEFFIDRVLAFREELQTHDADHTDQTRA